VYIRGSWGANVACSDLEREESIPLWNFKRSQKTFTLVCNLIEGWAGAIRVLSTVAADLS
jgi:hypothetical protein